MATEAGQHFAAKLRGHSGIVFAVDEEGFAVGAHASLNVGDRADGRPVVAELIDGDVFAKTLPNVVSGHTLAHDVGVIGGEVQEAARFSQRGRASG